MGKRGGFRGRGNKRTPGQSSTRTPDGRDRRGEEIPRENERYQKYYDSLLQFDEVERSAFWQALQRDLPNSFRFTGGKRQALPVQELLRNRYVPQITAIEHNGQPVTPPEPVTWLGDEQLAWQMTTPKNVIRRFAPFADFQKFLVSETGVGNISRQELVSMIPPLLMDLQPGMSCLDMCAAPGSKAAQLVEMLHRGEEERMKSAKDDQVNDDGRATGLLIANDSDYKRAHMLTHQMKRLNSPNLIVTNHDATMFPSIKLAATDRNQYLKFDRILADVPCSGDGTSRKNVNVWKDWTPANALGLFSTQLRILVRAVQMLKPGGRVVYSTCSMNPVENEAVVQAAVRRCGGIDKVKLVDCSAALPKMQRRPGLRRWTVMDRQGSIWDSWADFQARKGEENAGRLTEDMFSVEEPIPLERCMRVYPHLQDTGGFFITVLEKAAITVLEKAAKTPAAIDENNAKSSIIDIVGEIEQRPKEDVTQRIETLDAIAPAAPANGIEGTSAVARQNKEVAPSFASSTTKRKTQEEADALMATKRPRFREEVDDPAPAGAEDRQVHYPPPPGAELEVSQPSTRAGKIPDISSPPKQPSVLNGPEPKKARQTFEEPFKYLDCQHPELQSITSFYAVSDQFPRDRYMVRNATGQPAKTIYYTSALAKEILIANASSGIKFVHCGVKMFVKQDVQSAEVCRWRIQSEGLPIIEPWVGEERCVRLRHKSTLRELLIEMFPKIEGGGWRNLGEIGERVRDVGMGCCVLRVEASEGEENVFEHSMVLPLWRSLHSLNLMLPKEDRKAMLLRLYNEDTPLMDHSKQRYQSGDADPSD